MSCVLVPWRLVIQTENRSAAFPLSDPMLYYLQYGADETSFTPTLAYGLNDHVGVSTGGDDNDRLPLKISAQTVSVAYDCFQHQQIEY